MDASLLKLQNRWWENPNWVDEDQHLVAIAHQPYRFRPAILEAVTWETGDIHILRGPRQVGKTTTLKMMIQERLQTGTAPDKIFYLSCEAIASFQELQGLLVDYLQPRRARRCFVFIDEISFVESWQRAVLGAANLGLTANATLILTGSNARDLKVSGERLPGRRGHGKDLQLYPLSLNELGELACFCDKPFAELLEIYFRVGGFPLAVAEFVSLGTVTDATYEIYRNWIVGDAHRYGLRQETLKQILYRVAETISTRVTWPKLIENSPVRSHETALEYVEHLNDAFLCRIHYCYDPETKGPAQQKARKLYFIDPLLYAIARCWREGTSNIAIWMQQQLRDSEFRGDLFESVVVNHAARLHPQSFYWYSAKTQKEVDLLIQESGRLRLYEIKWSGARPFRVLDQPVEIIDPAALKNFLSFRS